MNYDETEQKQILHEMEGDLLALVAVEIATGDFEVIYSDGAYRDYGNRFRGERFFEEWRGTGLSMVHPDDRERMEAEISPERLSAELRDSDEFCTLVRFIVHPEPRWARIKVARDVLEPGVFVISIRDVDREVRRELMRAQAVQDLRSRLEQALKRIEALSSREHRAIYMRTFGRFTVLNGGVPVPLTGKAKEILALLVAQRGRELSNEEIYRIVWEGRDSSNASMTVYFNALRRLKAALADAGISELLLSTPHGQMVDTHLFDCDYYAWLDGTADVTERFDGEFLEEYSWAESLKPHLSK